MEAFAVTPPGFEDLVAAELRALGLNVTGAETGGVAFLGGWPEVYRANLMSRVASRILVRVGRFEASGFRDLERRLARIDWRRWLPPGSALDIRVTSRQSRMYHTGKVVEVVLGVLGRPGVSGSARSGAPAQRLQVRIVGTDVTVSVDTSGEHLHRRGYRTEVGRAPLRENLVAGLLMRASWNGSEPLIDPFCGSGTFPIEGALLALQVPPGHRRSFAFEEFPSFDPRRWQTVRDEAEAHIRESLLQPIFASDRDPESLRLTARAAGRAGVGDHVQVALDELEQLAAPAPSGLLVANPPYGRRLAGEHSARAALGMAFRGAFRDWRWGVVVADQGRKSVFGARPSALFRFKSGGIRLAFAVGAPSGLRAARTDDDLLSPVRGVRCG